MGLIKSLTRLMVGAAVSGYDVLANKLEEWDTGEEYFQSPDPETVKGNSLTWNASPTTFEGSTVTYEGELLSASYVVDSQTEDTTRHAVIGFIFESQRRIGRGFGIANKFIGFLGRKSKPLINSISRNRGLNPARKSFGSLMIRGEQELKMKRL